MTIENFLRALRVFSKRKPFRPFQVVFVTGESLTVVHPEAIHAREALLVFTGPDGAHRLFDSSSVNQLRDPQD
jgi:hypothetical protein